LVPAQPRGEPPTSTPFWKRSPKKQKRNEGGIFPGSSSVTPANVPEAAALSRARPSGPLRALDIRRLASGHKFMRATDEEASGGGSVKGSIGSSKRHKGQKQKGMKAISPLILLPSFPVL
jgi:hypothetical protein